MSDKKTFEILILEQIKEKTEKPSIADAESLLHSMRSLTSIWRNDKEVKVDEDNLSIISESLSLNIKKNQSKDIANQKESYLLTLVGGFDAIEEIRIPVVSFIKNQRFDYIYITRDDVSESIACDLYPHMYRIENRLRGYITKFMTTRLDGEWWKTTASQEMTDKTKMRKKNETEFGKHIDNSSFLIDFDELGKLIFEQASGFLTREEIFNRVVNLAESIDELRKLKSDIQSNYQKFFKETFADKNFKEKWKTWEFLRNKIAHTNLFTKNDLDSGIKTAKEIIEIIDFAEQAPNQPKISQIELEAVQEKIIAQTDIDDVQKKGVVNIQAVASVNGSLNSNNSRNESSISYIDRRQKEFLDELAKQENIHNKNGGFVGLTRFIRYHLPSLNFGYTEEMGSDTLKQLEKDNKVEVYTVPNPYKDHPTSALRVKKPRP